MKKIGFFGFLGALALVSGAANADVRFGGAIDQLSFQANQLEQQVQYAALNYNVKRVVYDFSRTVSDLAYCANRGFGGGRNNFRGNVPGYCRNQLQSVQSSFYQVSSYLSGTQWEFPQVYNQWLNTSRALNALHVDGGPGPGPGPGPIPHSYQCVARDTGWEEHFGGHLGYGRTLAEAQRQALGQCQSAHGRCVIQSCN